MAQISEPEFIISGWFDNQAYISGWFDSDLLSDVNFGVSDNPGLVDSIAISIESFVQNIEGTTDLGVRGSNLSDLAGVTDSVSYTKSNILAISDITGTTDSASSLLTGSGLTFSATMLALSPWGYWKLDEASGTTAADSSGNGRGGTYVNSPTLNQTAISGGLGPSTLFFSSGSPPSDPYMNVSTSLAALGSYTIMAWVSVTSFPSSIMAIVDSDYDGSRVPFEMTIDATNHAAGVSYFGGVQYDVANTSAASTSTPYFITLSYDGSSGYRELRVNGSLVASDTHAGMGTPSGSTIRIGKPNTGIGGVFRGNISDVAIFNSVVSSADISSLYSAGGATPGTNYFESFQESMFVYDSLNYVLGGGFIGWGIPLR